MQSETKGFPIELEANVAQESQPSSFGLYEEYSQKTIAETIRACRESYEKADQQAREGLEAEVEIEVENFQIWLEDSKKLEPVAAHYCAASLKSLLLGLPTGKQVAMLFDVVLGK